MTTRDLGVENELHAIVRNFGNLCCGQPVPKLSHVEKAVRDINQLAKEAEQEAYKTGYIAGNLDGREDSAKAKQGDV